MEAVTNELRPHRVRRDQLVDGAPPAEAGGRVLSRGWRVVPGEDVGCAGGNQAPGGTLAEDGHTRHDHHHPLEAVPARAAHERVRLRRRLVDGEEPGALRVLAPSRVRLDPGHAKSL